MDWDAAVAGGQSSNGPNFSDRSKVVCHQNTVMNVGNSVMGILILISTLILHTVSGFKTGLEPGLICYQCVSTHPGCSLYNMDWRWYWGKICPRSDDRCVKIIERKGAEVVVTRDCLSNLEAFRTDIPADKYEGCKPATKDVKLGQFTFNSIDELDTKRNYYDNTTFCFCRFDHWCNHSVSTSANVFLILSLFVAASIQ